MYGPRESTNEEYSTLIGNWKYKFSKNLPFIIFGDGSKKRDFTHVDDIVDAIIKIINQKSYGYTFELGRGKPYCINHILKLFNYKNVIYMPDRKGEINNSSCKDNLAKKILNWVPKKNIKDYISSYKSTN